MRGHREVHLTPSGQSFAYFQGSRKSLRITSLADPHTLTPIESHPYEKIPGATPPSIHASELECRRMDAMSDDLRLSIEKLVYGGDGLAHADGNTIFVPYVLPGEEVRAATKTKQKKLLWADLLEVTSP